MWNPYNNADNPYGNQPDNPYGRNNQNPYTGRRPSPSKPSGDSLAMAAMLLGILSVTTVFMLMFHFSMIFGSIGIVLAVLSKGRACQIVGKAKTGMFCAAIGIAISFSLCSSAFIALYTNPVLMEQVNEVFEEWYGISYEDMMDTILDNSGIPVNERN